MSMGFLAALAPIVALIGPLSVPPAIGNADGLLAPRVLRVEFHMSRQEEDESVAFCTKAGLGNNDFCGCWTGALENDFSRQDYRAYRQAITSKTPLTGDFKIRIDALVTECQSLTSGAR